MRIPVMIIRRHYFFALLACAMQMSASLTHPAFAADAPSIQSYFDMTESHFDNLAPFIKWTGMVERFTEQKKIPDDRCGTVRSHPCAIVPWNAWIATLHGRALQDQLDAVNSWGNSHPYITDQVNWGMEDYWETPYEFMDVSGDCEDYAIAKYYTLRTLGFPAGRMRVMIVEDLNLGGIIHAVLGVYDNDRLLILDNQSQQVIPALQIYHYRPVYGINEEAWWAYYPKKG